MLGCRVVTEDPSLRYRNRCRKRARILSPALSDVAASRASGPTVAETLDSAWWVRGGSPEHPAPPPRSIKLFAGRREQTRLRVRGAGSGGTRSGDSPGPVNRDGHPDWRDLRFPRRQGRPLARLRLQEEGAPAAGLRTQAMSQEVVAAHWHCSMPSTGAMLTRS